MVKMAKDFEDYLTKEEGKMFYFAFLDGKTLVGKLEKVKRYNFVVKRKDKVIHIFKSSLKYMYEVPEKE